MLKWTVSRSLSTASSTPHGPGGGTRKPFRDLSNTPPAGSESSRISLSRTTRNSNSSNATAAATTTSSSDGTTNVTTTSRRSTPGLKRTPSKRRKRCRSQGSDLRGYFQATKPSRMGKRQSLRHSSKNSPSATECFYQSTPRVDTDIGPLFPSRYSNTNSVTLPTDPQTIPKGGSIFPASRHLSSSSNNELPQNLVNEARANNLQSHVSDFFQQISMATSPEDIIEFESLPFASRRYTLRREENRTPYLPKLAKFTKLHARMKTPYQISRVIEGCRERCVDVDGLEGTEASRQTPLAGKLSGLRLDQNTPMYENVDNTVTKILKEQESNFGCKSVAEILLKDSAERRKVLGSNVKPNVPAPQTSSPRNNSPTITESNEHIYETIYEKSDPPPSPSVVVAAMDLDESKYATHNDSSVSSASQLLDNPSPLSWPLYSPNSDQTDQATGEFPLRRQRAIRRKRQANNKDSSLAVGSSSKRPRQEQLCAVNKLCVQMTTFDSSVVQEGEEKEILKSNDTEVAQHELQKNREAREREEMEEKDSSMNNSTATQLNETEALLLSEKTRDGPEPGVNLSRRRCQELSISHVWDTDSPKSSLLDSFATSTTTSALCTPEAPLVATVRRCLKYSPETPGGSEHSRSKTSNASNCLGFNRGSIEIECYARLDQIHVKIIRCRDLRRAYEGPINAYVKASIKDPLSGEGRVKRTAVHRSTPNPVFHESLVLPCPPVYCNNNCTTRQVSLDIAVWHRDRRARRSELLGCMTLPLPLSQDKEATWHPLEAGSGRNTSSAPAYGMQQESTGGGGRGSLASPPLSKDGAESIVTDNNNGSTTGGGSTAEDLTYLRHLELEPIDPLTGLPLHPAFTAQGGRTPCTVTRQLVRPAVNDNQVPWGFSLSWGRPPRVERVDPGSPAERSGLRPGDYVVFVDSTNVVTQLRDDILELIQAAQSQLVLEVYRRTSQPVTSAHSSVHRPPSAVNVSLHQAAPAALPTAGRAAVVAHPTIAFTAEPFPSLVADAPPEEELHVREQRYWTCLKSGQARFMTPLTERRDVLAASDYLILFQNLEELLKLSDEIREEGSGIDSYLNRVPRLTASYRRYLGGLQRACCLLVALRKNSAFAKIVCEPAVPRKRKPDITGVLLQPLEHYREMTRLLCQVRPRNCQPVRDLAQGYREATANAAMMEPPRDTGRPLLSLQEVESRLVFARCQPFTLAVPGRQWLFGGALAKVEGRGRLQSIWALLLSDLLVFARISRDRVLFVTEEPLRLACIAEACFTVRKRPTEFRLQITTQPSAPGENLASSSTEIVQCGGIGGGVGVGGGCSPHSRPRRRVLILRAPSPELKAVWHNLLQRQM